MSAYNIPNEEEFERASALMSKKMAEIDIFEGHLRNEAASRGVTFEKIFAFLSRENYYVVKIFLRSNCCARKNVRNEWDDIINKVVKSLENSGKMKVSFDIYDNAVVLGDYGGDYDAFLR